MRTLLFLLSSFSLLGALPQASLNTYDYEARLWRISTRTNSSDVTASSYRIATVFMLNIKRWGVRQCLVYCLPYQGTNLTACKMPLIHDVTGSHAAVVTSGFVAGDYSEATGLTGDGSSKFISLGFGMDTVGTFAHMSAYARATPTAAHHILIGANSSPNGNSYIYHNVVDDTVNGDMCSTASVNCKASDTGRIGLYMHSRTSTSNSVMYVNGVSVATDTVNEGVNPGAVVIFIHAWDNVGSPLLYTSRPISYADVGKAMNATQALNHYRAVQRKELSLNRAK